MEKENLKKILYRFIGYLPVIFAGFMMLLGAITVSKNAGILFGISHSYNLGELSVNKLRSGMCVEDTLFYTYGHISTEILPSRVDEVYVVDMGEKRDQYIVIKKEKHSLYGNTTEFDNLQKVSLGHSSDAGKSNGVKIYGIVEKTNQDYFNYTFFQTGLRKMKSEIKSDVATKYDIRIINPSDIVKSIVKGVWEIIIGGIVALYIRWRLKKRKTHTEETEAAEMTEKKEKKKKTVTAPLRQYAVANMKIMGVDIVFNDMHIRLDESEQLEKIVKILCDVTEVTKSANDVPEEICTMNFEFEDCSFMMITLYDKCKFRYMEDIYLIEYESAEKLKIMLKEIAETYEKRV